MENVQAKTITNPEDVGFGPVNHEGFIGRPLSDHKNNKFNREHIVVKTADLRSSDNAHHKYMVQVLAAPESSEKNCVVSTCEIEFQNGGLKEVGPNGITDQALLAIVLDGFEVSIMAHFAHARTQ